MKASPYQIRVATALGRGGCDLALLSEVRDGGPAKGKGGSADVVAYARGRGVPLVHIDPCRSVARE